MKGDIAVAGFRMTAEEWQALDPSSRAELVKVITHKDEPQLAAGSGPIPVELGADPESGAVLQLSDLDPVTGAILTLSGDTESGAILQVSELGPESGAILKPGEHDPASDFI